MPGGRTSSEAERKTSKCAATATTGCFIQGPPWGSGAQPHSDGQGVLVVGRNESSRGEIVLDRECHFLGKTRQQCFDQIGGVEAENDRIPVVGDIDFIPGVADFWTARRERHLTTAQFELDRSRALRSEYGNPAQGMDQHLRRNHELHATRLGDDLPVIREFALDQANGQ